VVSELRCALVIAGYAAVVSTLAVARHVMMKAEEASATRTELSIVFSLALGAGLVAEAPSTIADVPTCHGKRATIVGTVREDSLRGTSKPDVIVARGGSDLVNGIGGDDMICGGAGGDSIDAGGGANVVYGGGG
jgi:Ca2+-binding RTX toxin-like protein